MRLTDPDGDVLTVAQVETPVDPARALEANRLDRRRDPARDGREVRGDEPRIE
jgi:hypothetical protein